MGYWYCRGFCDLDKKNFFNLFSQFNFVFKEPRKSIEYIIFNSHSDHEKKYLNEDIEKKDIKQI